MVQYSSLSFFSSYCFVFVRVTREEDIKRVLLRLEVEIYYDDGRDVLVGY